LRRYRPLIGDFLAGQLHAGPVQSAAMLQWPFKLLCLGVAGMLLLACEKTPKSETPVSLAGCEIAKPEAPEHVVCVLYSDFPVDGKKAVHEQPKEALAKYFDEALVALFVENQQCEKKSESICRIDFSILYDAQDYEITGLRVGGFDGNKSAIEVHFENFGKPVVVSYKLSKAPQGWRISDVDYQTGNSLVGLLTPKKVKREPAVLYTRLALL
jgi:hypothetical protein